MPAFRADELKVICDEAHRLGKRVTAHARSGEAVAACIEAKVDWLMHGDFMDKRQADALAESGIPCCPTLTFVANVADWGHLVGCSQARIDRFRRDLDEAVINLDYAWRNGVTMMCGTDSGFAVTPYGEWHARERERVGIKQFGLRFRSRVPQSHEDLEDAARLLGRSRRFRRQPRDFGRESRGDGSRAGATPRTRRGNLFLRHRALISYAGPIH